MNPHYRDLAFLLSLGSLPLACGEKEPADSTDSTTGPGPMTDPALTDPGPTDPGLTDPGPTDPGPTDDSTTGAAIDPCQAYADSYVGCYPAYASYGPMLVQECKELVAEGMTVDGPNCAAAVEAYFACLSMLSCAELSGDGNDDPCPVEITALETACPNLAKDDPGDPSDTFADTGTDDDGGTDESDVSGSITDTASETG